MAVALFSYVFLVEQIKTLKKEKVNKEDFLLERNNKLSASLVEVQKLSSKERIAKIAEERLGLVNPSGPFEVLRVNKESIEKLNDAVRGNNE